MSYPRGNNGLPPIHPGEHLREDFMIPLGLSASALALALHLPAPSINEIVREKRSITPRTAARLAKYFGTSTEYWLRWQAAYDAKVAEVQEAEAVARITPSTRMQEMA